MQAWKQPQEAISGIPLLQAGQWATSWDQLVFILFILELFEEGSCKLFLTELMESPLSFESVGWVKRSWIGQSSVKSCSWWCFLPWYLPYYNLVNLTLYLQCSHSLSPYAYLVQIPLYMPLIGPALRLTRAINFPSSGVNKGRINRCVTCLEGKDGHFLENIDKKEPGHSMQYMNWGSFLCER